MPKLQPGRKFHRFILIKKIYRFLTDKYLLSLSQLKTLSVIRVILSRKCAHLLSQMAAALAEHRSAVGVDPSVSLWINSSFEQ